MVDNDIHCSVYDNKFAGATDYLANINTNSIIDHLSDCMFHRGDKIAIAMWYYIVQYTLNA